MNQNGLLIQQLFPDEHLASSIARTLLISGFDIKELRQFLAPKQRGLTLQPIVACFYVRWCKPHLNQAEIFAKHTLLNFYQHSMHIEVRRRIFDKLDFHNIKLSLPTQTRFGHSWRFCPECVIEDEVQVGTSYWHVQHQLPTARTCHKHSKTVLLESCHHCGYKFVDLVQDVTPSLNCPGCRGQLFDHTSFIHNADTFWLQETGSNFQSADFNWMRPAHEFALRYQLPLSFSDFTKKHKYRQDAVLQAAFLEWLRDTNLIEYLIPEKWPVAHRFFSEKVVREHSLSAPILSKLLWKRYLTTQ